MKRYSKLIAAGIGIVGIILGPSVLGLAPDDQAFLGMDKLFEIVVGILTAAGVWGATNDPT